MHEVRPLPRGVPGSHRRSRPVPRDVILDLRQRIDHQRRIPALLDREVRSDGTGPAAGSHGTGLEIAGDVVTERALWACTTCMACLEAYPVGIEHVPIIVQLRRRLVDQGRMEPTLQTALQNLAQQGNSFGKSARMRARWTKGLDFPVKDARKEAVELLWFVGDHASFDERMQSLSQALARVLHRAGVDFGGSSRPIARRRWPWCVGARISTGSGRRSSW